MNPAKRTPKSVSRRRAQTFTVAEVRELYLAAYEDGLAAGYLDGERDGHDRALAEYVAMLPTDDEPHLPWVSGDELRDRLNTTDDLDLDFGR